MALVPSLAVVGNKEQREIHLAILSVLPEVWQLAEVISLRMLQHYYCARLQHLGVKQQLGHIGKVWQVVWRVGKNHVKLHGAFVDKLKNIAFHLSQVLLFQQAFHLANKVELRGSFLHTCPRKQVKGSQAVEVNIVFKHVEYVFARKVGCGACGDVGWHIETPTAIFSSYYSHSARVNSSNGAATALSPRRMAAAGKMAGIT